MRKLITILIFSIVCTNINTAPPETFLNFVDYCKYLNYPSETHKITTNDGYILTYHRV